MAALAAFLGVGCGPGTPSLRPDLEQRPNVLLVTLDTTRADRLGLYGYSRDTSPNLDRLAEESVVYTRAVATSSWTLPSHASIFTGLLPSGHGAHHDPDGSLVLREGIEDRGFPPIRVSSIAPSEQTLAQRLKAAGYATGGIAAGPWLKRVFGLAAGFDRYYEEGVTVDGVPATQVTNAAIRFLEGFGDGPFFLFANYFDPHSPRLSPAEHWTALGLEKDCPDEVSDERCWIAGYDAEVHYMDQELGRLFDWLRQRGLWDSLLVVVTADHGELLGEFGRTGHGRTLTEAELHVPLLVKPPGGQRPARRVNDRVSIAGIFASILERTSLEVPADAEPALEESVAYEPVAETSPPHWKSGPNGHWRAIYSGSYKLLWNSDGDHRLYQLVGEAPEARNLYYEQRRVADGLLERLEARIDRASRAPRPAAEERTLDEPTRRALKNLGYVE